MRTKLTLIWALIMCFNSIQAQNGHALFSSCQNVKYLQKQAIDTQTAVFEAGYCLGMIYGVYATLLKVDKKNLCLPVLGLSNQEKVKIVTEHLKTNPQHLKKEDIVLIMDAFNSKFSCSKTSLIVFNRH